MITAVGRFPHDPVNGRTMFRKFPIQNLPSLTPRRIAIIKPSALGDVAQTLPLLGVLHAAYPGTEIDWVISSSFANLLEGHPLIRNVIPYHRRGHGWREWLGLLRTLRQARYDLVFDLQGLLRTGIMTQATRAPVRIGLECAREGAWLAYHAAIPNTRHGQPAHALYWRLAETLGHPGASRQAQIAISDADRQFAADQLSPLGRRIVTLAPGAQWVTKRWPPEKFAEIAARTAQTWDAGICLIGSPAESEVAAEIEGLFRLRTMRPLVNLAGATTLKQLSAILAASDLVVSNDSGPLHLAAALDRPVVGIFLCTSAVRSGPVGTGHETVSTSVACAASYKKTCPQSGSECLACLRELDVERVWQAVQKSAGARFAQPAAPFAA